MPVDALQRTFSDAGSIPATSTLVKREYITEQEAFRRDAEALLRRLNETPAHMVVIYNNLLEEQRGLHAHDTLLLAEFNRLASSILHPVS